MNPNYTRRLVGAAAALFGFWWIWFWTLPVVHELWIADNKAGDIFFFLPFHLSMAIPGVLALIFGIRLFITMSVSSLKWIVGLFAVFGTTLFTSQLLVMFPELLPELVSGPFFLFLSSLIAMPVYLLVTKKLIRHLTEQDPSYLSLIGQGYLVLMAWLLWLLLSSVFQDYSPFREEYSNLPVFPWAILELFVPIVVAYGLYRIFAALLAKAQEGSAEQPATAGESK